MKYLLLTLLVFPISVLANKSANKKLNIYFSFERDGKNDWDVRFSPTNLVYGKKKVEKSFRKDFTQRNIVRFFPTFESGTRIVEITVCIQNTAPKSLAIKDGECHFFEKISMQFRPGEVLKMPSKVDKNSRYIIDFEEIP